MPGALNWRGYVLVDGSVFPFTSCDISRVVELYPSVAIHGGGLNTVDGVFHSQHNVAQGRLTANGTIRGEVFGGTGNYATAFKKLLQRAIGAVTSNTALRDSGFDGSAPLIFNAGRSDQLFMPSAALAGGGVRKAVVSRMTLNGNPNGIVGVEFQIMSSGADDQTSTPPVVTDFEYEKAQLADDSSPVPFWQTCFDVVGTGEPDLKDRITDWTITVNNNTTPIWAMNGQQQAVDILQGIMEVTGSFTYYSGDGSFVDELIHGATLTITLGAVTLNSPYMAFGEQPIPATGPNDPTYRTVQFRCLAQETAASLHIT